MPRNSDLATLEELAEAIRQDYPRREILYSQTVQVDFEPPAGGDPLVGAAQRQDGFQLFSADGLNIVHLRLNGFTYIRLKPYTGWETFSTEARRLWAAYKSACRVVSIDRAAIRYIDRLDLSASEDVAEYLRLVPHLPDDFPIRGVKGFFQQLLMPLEDPKGELVINVAQPPGPQPRDSLVRA